MDRQPIAIITSAICHPYATRNSLATGMNKNCPAEPAAVPIPKAIALFSGLTILAIAGSTTPSPVPAIPIPIKIPAPK